VAELEVEAHFTTFGKGSFRACDHTVEILKFAIEAYFELKSPSCLNLKDSVK